MIPLALAFQFLTILPLRLKSEVQDDDLAKSVGWYPIVGALMGLFSVLVYLALMRLVGTVAAVVSAVVALVMLSGALHLDGFADMCDGFYAGKNKDEILSIMKDSHVGAMAVIGLICVLALKLAFLLSISEFGRMPALILAPTLGRWSMAFLCAASNYARSEGGTARPFIGHVGKLDLAQAAVFALLVSWLTLGVGGLALFAAATVFALIFKQWVGCRINGMTGDTLGACNEIVEVLIFALMSIHDFSIRL